MSRTDATVSANWSGYWGKQGPELLASRLAQFEEKQRMVFGATTFRDFTGMLADSTEDSDVRDPWVTRMWKMPATAEPRNPSRRARSAS